MVALHDPAHSEDDDMSEKCIDDTKLSTHSSSTFRTHESRILGSGDSDKHLDDFLPEYLRPPKDPFEDEPRFADAASLPNYLGNPNSIYRLRPHKSGSYGSSETSTGSSSSSNHYNGYFKNSGTSTDKITDTDQSTKATEEKITREKSAAEEQPLDPLNPVYSTEYVGYSTTSDAVRVVRKNPRVRVVSRLVDFALVEPDEDDDDKPGEDVINYIDLVNMLKGTDIPTPNAGEAEQGNLIDFSDDVLISTASSMTLNTTMTEPVAPQPLSLLDM
ncbi:hypothetical protein ANCDUO_06597 [Ancylostoma duodenale]|uniref:Uncharacterized protein n=1 Tax=Ancylostoma duodenale TaxID=51022 RepID=A0A0C2D189_9BILA|nr:hypothetical protein ANCDUO_06597 [Ancylostoma duodenale]